MRTEQIVNVEANEIFGFAEDIFLMKGMTEAGAFETDTMTFVNPSTLVTVLENADEVVEYQDRVRRVPQPAPQVYTIFIPVFKTKTIKLRQMIVSDDWVADCQLMDTKYGVWFMTIEPAIALLNNEYSIEV